MTNQTTLDVKGSLRTYPLAELIVEIVHARLDGSLRLSHEEKKSILYFRDGSVVYAASNARALRLFSVMLAKGSITRSDLAAHRNFANDFELAGSLLSKGAFTKPEIDAAVIAQIEAVMVDALTWPDGEWLFSPAVRSRPDLIYDVDLFQLLANYARCLSSDEAISRFKSVKEAFSKVSDREVSVNLQPHESYVLSRFDEAPLTIEELRHLSSMPEAEFLQALYVLWLGGALRRGDWNSAFTATRVAAIKSAKMERVREAERPTSGTVSDGPPPEPPKVPKGAADHSPPVIDLSLEQYLIQVETAKTKYEVLGLDRAAETGQIKRSYLGMAKMFHPDHFHREEPAVLRRIQSAFTELAHAYEALKSPESREAYDLKLSRELKVREEAKVSGVEYNGAEGAMSENGLRAFEAGVTLLAEQDFAEAAVQLARAVHYDPKNAMYRAYYGKALAGEGRQRHKAESEMQTATRLEPGNAKLRIMLAEFYVDMGMLKRAEGELKRFLEIAPENAEVSEMLANLYTGVMR